MNENGPVNVLLVDDTPANLTALDAILAEPGLNLLRATSGEEALRILADRDVAVVLLDVRMPGLSGHETARRLRGGERSARTPVIFLTADMGDREAVTDAYELGAVDYLVKPLIPVVVRAKVAALVDLFRQTERARREADQLRMLVQGTTEYAIFMLDPDGAVATWNSGAERLKGYRADEIVGRHFSTFYPREALDRGWPAEELRRAVADGRLEDEGWRVRKDGTTFWANVVITALRDGQGRLQGFSKVTRDLTERREREEALRRLSVELERRVEERTAELTAANGALRKKEAELTDFVENATVGLHWVGPDGTILWANRAEFEMLGYAREEYVGRNLAEFHADPPVVEDILRRLVGGEELHGYEARLRRKDGAIRHVLVSSSVYRENGEFRHTRCFTRDVTERKLAEDALRERDRQKDEFMAMLAHELRNPIAPIQNALQVLELKKDEETVEKVRQIVGRQVGQLSHLVNDLLEAARVTARKVTLRRELLDLAQLARVAAHDASAMFETSGVALAVETPETPVWVSGDWTRLTQVVGNLLGNAAKFTPPGGRVAVAVAAENGTARLRVSDTGEGITPELMGKLFTPFIQGEQGLARSQGGLGLGLALVKGLTELHGGTVTAESAGPGRGTTFSVRLPRSAEPPAVSGGRDPQRTPPGRRLRVLIVEDNVDSAESLRMVLELGGCEVHVTHTGPDGVAEAKRLKPNFVLCDIGLPGFNGFEVARQIRAEANGSVVLVALTGYGRDEDREAARAAGFNVHFTKPVDFSQLEKVLSGKA